MENGDQQITIEELKRFFDETSAFSWGFKQDVLNFIKTVVEKGFHPQFALRCIAIRKQAEAERVSIEGELNRQWKERAPKCPECGGQMRLEPVNTRPGDQVPGRYKSIWICEDTFGCGYDELSRRDMAQWLTKLQIRPRRPARSLARRLDVPFEALAAAIEDPEAPSPEFND